MKWAAKVAAEGVCMERSGREWVWLVMVCGVGEGKGVSNLAPLVY